MHQIDMDHIHIKMHKGMYNYRFQGGLNPVDVAISSLVFVITTIVSMEKEVMKSLEGFHVACTS